MWSKEALAMWGKTDAGTGAWLPLVQHLEDTRRVAGHLWDRWLPMAVKERIVESVGGKAEDGRALTSWLASVHDVGKATPAFAAQLYERPELEHVLRPLLEAGLTVPRLARSARQPFRHTVTGEVVVESWLREVHGFTPRRATHLGGIIGGHHGLPLGGADQELGISEQRNPTSRLFGDAGWRSVQAEILGAMLVRTSALAALGYVREHGLALTAQMDLSAIVIVADWLASDPRRFPYDLSLTPEVRWEAGRATLDLAGPWSPPVPPSDHEQHLHERFPKLRDYPIHPVQAAAARIADQVHSPPLMIIEAPMGHGKTEAALLAAERLAHRFGLGGVFVGLPTMATSDAMFGRVLDWLDHGSTPSDPSVYLAHSKARLNETYRGLLTNALRAQEIYDDHVEGNDRSRAPMVDIWTTGRKKGVLASVVVGTIDQALFAGLQTKHLVLRHLALTGKVVIIDEVHAADDYMRSYLCRVLEWLGSYRTPVVLMSATLPSDQRQELADAYLAGCGGSSGSVADDDGYPRITMITDRPVCETVATVGGSARVLLELIPSDPQEVADRITAEVGDGGCAAIVCNTVGRAQLIYDAVRRHLPAEDIILVHSRFIGPHRMSLESRLRAALGPEGHGVVRPSRLVVVGTQVLEQSLDIDVDIMVTDIAPIDLVLQRSGRLHRHARPSGARPPHLGQPRLLLTGIDGEISLDHLPPPLDAGSLAVYGHYRLLRAMEALASLTADALTLPHDIPALVERAYDESVMPPAAWADPWRTARARRRVEQERALSSADAFRLPSVRRQRSLVNLMPAAVPAESDDLERVGRAQVRDSDDALEVILATKGGDGLVRMPDGSEMSGAVVPSVLTGSDASLARALAACTVRLPRSLTHPAIIDTVIAELEQEPAVVGWQQSPDVAGQLVLLMNPDGVGTLCGHRVVYDPVRGLTVEREERQST